MVVLSYQVCFSGQKKASTAKNGKKTSKAELSSDERFVPHLDIFQDVFTSFFFFLIYKITFEIVYLSIVFCCYSFYSDEENVPEVPPSVRPSRRAKMASLEKTKQDLTALMNQEANGS